MECLFLLLLRLGDTAGGGDDWGSDYALCQLLYPLDAYSSPSSMIAQRSTLINFAATQKVIHEEGLIENSNIIGERLNKNK